MPSSRPWRRSTSWQPAMQPAKSCATSNNALLQSVTRASSASRSSSMRPAAIAAWMRACSATALFVQTLQWPSSPPRMRTRTSAPSRITANGVAQVEHDVVVVAGVERHAVLGARRDDAAHDVERAVAVERRHLDRDDVVDAGEATPELDRRAQCRRPRSAGRSRPAESRRRPPRSVRRVRRSRRPASARATACRRGSPRRARRAPRPAPARSCPDSPATSSTGRCAQVRASSAASRSTVLVEPRLADRELGGVHARPPARRRRRRGSSATAPAAGARRAGAPRRARAGAPESRCRGAAAQARRRADRSSVAASRSAPALISPEVRSAPEGAARTRRASVASPRSSLAQRAGALAGVRAAAHATHRHAKCFSRQSANWAVRSVALRSNKRSTIGLSCPSPSTLNTARNSVPGSGFLQRDVDLHGQMFGAGDGVQTVRRRLGLDPRRQLDDEGHDADLFLHRQLGGPVVHALDALDAGDAGAQRLEIANEIPEFVGRGIDGERRLALMHQSHHLPSLKSSAITPAALCPAPACTPPPG